ncbi:MAG: hypothetical protein PHC60_07120 [Heliobacteriaceae bacterium]|nr:hypothetical protein [Heliobacteriaceae bacterium]MDD4588141.1 hypothetical protein [Heliobacteriaceae bacterium]
MQNSFSVQAFMDGLHRIVEKETKTVLARSEFQVTAELLPRRSPVGEAVLWMVLDLFGQTMLWMVPEELAGKFQPGNIVVATGFPVLWPGGQGKRFPWLQVKTMRVVSFRGKSRVNQARQLVRDGLLGRRRPKEWPVDPGRGSVKVHLVIAPNNRAGESFRRYINQGRRFNLQVHYVNMNAPERVAAVIEDVTATGGEFLFLVQQEENVLVFDQPVVLAALKNCPLYTILVQPPERIKPFACWLVEEWPDNLDEAVQQMIARCWQMWQGPRDRESRQIALLAQAQTDRTRFAAELSRLRQENRELRALAGSTDPELVTELETLLTQLEARLQKGEECRQVILAQLDAVETERDELYRRLAVGGEREKPPVVDEATVAARREQEIACRFARLETEVDELQLQNRRLKDRCAHTSPVVIEALKEEKTALSQELARSEERREQLSELLFILEQENRELKGRLDFREDPAAGEDGEELVVGQLRLTDEVHDLLAKEEIERLQREVKRLQDRVQELITFPPDAESQASVILPGDTLPGDPVGGPPVVLTPVTAEAEDLLERTIRFFKQGWRRKKT